MLGVEWLATVGIIKWHFQQLKMESSFLGRVHVLRGIKAGKVQLMMQGQLPKALKTAGHLCMLQFIPSTPTSFPALESHTKQPVAIEVQQLLDAHQDLFHKPNTLPPSRGHFYYRIPLKEGTSPINTRP